MHFRGAGQKPATPPHLPAAPPQLGTGAQASSESRNASAGHDLGGSLIQKSGEFLETLEGLLTGLPNSGTLFCPDCLAFDMAMRVGSAMKTLSIALGLPLDVFPARNSTLSSQMPHQIEATHLSSQQGSSPIQEASV